MMQMVYVIKWYNGGEWPKYELVRIVICEGGLEESDEVDNIADGWVVDVR